jgi:hypothetical protein
VSVTTKYQLRQTETIPFIIIIMMMMNGISNFCFHSHLVPLFVCLFVWDVFVCLMLCFLKENQKNYEMIFGRKVGK